MRSSFLLLALISVVLGQQASTTYTVIISPLPAKVGATLTATVTAVDSNKNTITNYTGTVVFSLDRLFGNETTPAGGTLTNGAGSFSFVLYDPTQRVLTVRDSADPSMTAAASVYFYTNTNGTIATVQRVDEGVPVTVGNNSIALAFYDPNGNQINPALLDYARTTVTSNSNNFAFLGAASSGYGVRVNLRFTAIGTQVLTVTVNNTAVQLTVLVGARANSTSSVTTAPPATSSPTTRSSATVIPANVTQTPTARSSTSTTGTTGTAVPTLTIPSSSTGSRTTTTSTGSRTTTTSTGSRTTTSTGLRTTTSTGVAVSSSVSIQTGFLTLALVGFVVIML